MDAQVLNFKRYDSGAMVGFFDMGVGGLVVTGCKAFRKDDKCWFAWPSEKTTDVAGEVKYRDIVAAAEPTMRHLQGLVRGQLRAAMEAPEAPAAQRPSPGKQKFAGTAFKKPGAENLKQYRSTPVSDDIPF
jgi:hypothetical protein